MATGVKYTLEAESSRAQAAIKALARQVETANRRFDKLATASDRSGKSAERAGSIGARGAAAFAAQLGGVLSVTGLLRTAYAEWRKDIEETHRLATTTAKEIVSTVSSAGLLRELPQIEAIRSLVLQQIPTASPADFTAALDAVKGSRPDIGLQQTKSFVEQALRFEAAGDTDLGRAGTVIGQVSKAFRGSLSADDLGDVSKFVIEEAGRNAGKLESPRSFKGVAGLVGAGIDPDQVLGLLNASLRTDVGPDLVNAISQSLDKQFDVKKPGLLSALSDDDLVRNRLAGLDRTQRFEAIFQDQESARALLGDTYLAALRVVQQEGGIGDFVERARAARSGDLLASEAQLLGQTESGRRFLSQQEVSARQETARLGRSDIEGSVDLPTIKQAADAALLEEGASGFRRYLQGLTIDFLGFFYDRDFAVETLVRESSPGVRQVGQDLMQQILTTTPFGPQDRRAAEEQVAETRRLRESSERSNEIAERTNRLLEQNLRGNGGGLSRPNDPNAHL